MSNTYASGIGAHLKSVYGSLLIAFYGRVLCLMQVQLRASSAVWMSRMDFH